MSKIVSATFFPVPLQRFERAQETKTVAAFAGLEKAMLDTALQIKDSHPQTIILLSRYKLTLDDAIGISPQARLRGALDLGKNHPPITVAAETDHIFSRELRKQSGRMGIPLLDILDNLPTLSTDDYLLHPSAVLPLYYLEKAGMNTKQIVRLTMGRISYEEMYTFGRIIQKTAEECKRKVAVIVSSNMLSPRPVDPNDNSLDLNLTAMQALADQKPKLLNDIGYPPQDRLCFRAAAFILGVIGGLNAIPTIHHYELIQDIGYGLMHYKIG